MSIRLQHLREAFSFLSTFTGRVGELVVDTTNNRIIVHDGVTAGGWPAAKLSEVVVYTRTPVVDSNYTALSTDQLVAYTALTAARTVTLPSASSFPIGARLTIIDETGAASSTNSITLTHAGSDTINGVATVIIAMPYGYCTLESNGSNQWTLVAQAGAQLKGLHGSVLQLSVLEDLITCSGASSTSTIQIPNRAIVLAVSTYVVSAVTGATSFNVDATLASNGGSGTTAGQFGSSLGLALGSTNVGVTAGALSSAGLFVSGTTQINHNGTGTTEIGTYFNNGAVLIGGGSNTTQLASKTLTMSNAIISAAGTTQGTATALAASLNFVTTVASGSGVILQNAIGMRQEVFNRGANALLVYPDGSAQIESNAVNVAVSLAAGGHAVFECSTTTQCYQAP